jgi:hypothetical protein
MRHKFKKKARDIPGKSKCGGKVSDNKKGALRLL